MNLDDYREMMHDTRRAIENEMEKLSVQVEQMKTLSQMADVTDGLLSQVEDLKDENERLTQEVEKLALESEKSAQENDRLRREIVEKDMKLSELSKLSVGVAKKSSQEEVLKALRTYINISKRKTLSKRVAVKVMIMELANAIGIVFPEDMIATLETLDDEQSEPKVLVQGDYVENKGVENKYNAPVGQVIDCVEKLEYKAS